jgi:DNA repair protein RecO (recombination protein O)
MLVKTRGIVVSYIRYKESSIIVKIFNRELGLKAYIVSGVRSSNAKIKMGFYQPLTILDMVVYNKESAGLNRISEVKLAKAYQKIPFDFLRSGIAMFMAEVLSRSIYEGYQNEDLFDFLVEALFFLDDEQVVLSHYPNVFLWGMAKYLGFAPNLAEEFFGELIEDFNKQMDWKPEMEYLDRLMIQDFSFTEKVPAHIRRNLLDYLLVFFSKRLDQPAEWKSVKVLRQMMA